MSGLDKQIYDLVKKIKMRMFTAKALRYIFISSSAALGVGIIMAIVSRYIPIYAVYTKILFVLIIFLATGIVLAIYKMPKSKNAALRADSLGLSERTVTAIELIGDESSFAVIQKQDALRSLRNVDYKKGISIFPNQKYIALCLVLLAGLVTTSFIPNTMDNRAKEIHELKIKKGKQIKKVDKLIEKIKKSQQLSKVQKKELNEKLEELKKDIKTSKNKDELHKALQRSEKKMDIVKDKYNQNKENLNKLADTLAKFQGFQDIAKAIKSGDAGSMKKNMKELNKKLSNMTPQQKKELAQKLSKLADELKDNPELKKALAELSSKLASGQLSDLSNELNSLNKSINDLMQDEDFNQSMSEIMKQMQQMHNSQCSPGGT